MDVDGPMVLALVSIKGEPRWYVVCAVKHMRGESGMPWHDGFAGTGLMMEKVCFGRMVAMTQGSQHQASTAEYFGMKWCRVDLTARG